MRASVPLGRKLIAVVIAAATTFGLCACSSLPWCARSLRRFACVPDSVANWRSSLIPASHARPGQRGPRPVHSSATPLSPLSFPRPVPLRPPPPRPFANSRARLEATHWPPPGSSWFMLIMVILTRPRPCTSVCQCGSQSSRQLDACVSQQSSSAVQTSSPRQSAHSGFPAAPDALGARTHSKTTTSRAFAASPAAAPHPRHPASGASWQHVLVRNSRGFLAEVHAQLSAAGQHAGLLNHSFRSEHDRQR